MSEAILSDKANAFMLSVSSPPDWLIDLCRSPLGRSLFLYILKDSSLRAQFANGNYNGLVDFFVSTLIVDPATTYSDLKGISLSNVHYPRTLLFYERVLKSIAAASTTRCARTSSPPLWTSSSSRPPRSCASSSTISSRSRTRFRTRTCGWCWDVSRSACF